MKRFKNILMVANDRNNDRQSLRRAVELAERNNADLSILEVIDIQEKEISRISSRLKEKNLKQLFLEDRKAAIDALLHEADLSLSRLDVVFGIPFIKIIQHVQKYDFDLVITAAEGRGGLKEKLYGTTSLHLMRKCPCPLWILKPGRKKEYKKILAAVDPIDEDSSKEGLNRKIMELATSMAEIEKAELHILHAWDLVGESLLLHRTGMSRKDLDSMVGEEQAIHKKAMEELANRHFSAGIRRTSSLKRGNPGEVIPRYADKNQIDLIVMGTVCRHGIAGLLIGNTAEQVIQKVNASVLTVKPAGFVSPVH